jgi:hypothetical protein
MDFAPDGRIFVSERPGRIRIVEQGQLQREPWIKWGALPGSRRTWLSVIDALQIGA